METILVLVATEVQAVAVGPTVESQEMAEATAVMVVKEPEDMIMYGRDTVELVKELLQENLVNQMVHCIQAAVAAAIMVLVHQGLAVLVAAETVNLVQVYLELLTLAVAAAAVGA